MKLQLITICILFTIHTSGQWIELYGPGLNQPYHNLPSAEGSVTFTLGNTVYMGTGAKFFSVADYYYDNFFEYNIQTGKWSPSTQLSNQVNPRAFASSFTYDGKAYIGFGNNTNTEFADLWEIDTQSGTFTQKASMQVSRYNAITFVSGSKAYVGGGYTGGSQSGTKLYDFYNYDFSTNVWSYESQLPTDITPFLTFTMEVGNVGYMLNFGFSAGMYTRSFSRYDTLNHSWVSCAPYPGNAINGVVGFGFNDQGFVGFGNDSNSVELSEFFQYDPLNDSWTQKNSYSGMDRPYSKSYSNGVKAGIVANDGNLFEYDIVSDSWQEKVGTPFFVNPGKMIVIQNIAYGKEWLYNIPNDSWINSNLFDMSWVFQLNDVGYGFSQNVFSMFDPSLPVIPFLAAPAPPHGTNTFFSIGNKGYAGGFYSDSTYGFWEFDPQTQVWTRKADFPGPPRECGGGFSIGNKGYITGGWCDSLGWYIYDFWQYDPQADNWSRKADGPTGFLGSFMEGDATRGYVGCGIWDAIGSDNGDVSVYNPDTDTWSSLPSLLPRHNLYSFIANDHLYAGGGNERLSMTEGIIYYDLFKLPLAGINTIEEAGNSSFEIFPNPSNGKFLLKSNNNLQTITIYSIKGEKLFSVNLIGSSALIDLQNKLPAGTYLLYAKTSTGTMSRKIIILPE